jgi:hypothetical protein
MIMVLNGVIDMDYKTDLIQNYKNNLDVKRTFVWLI